MRRPLGSDDELDRLFDGNAAADRTRDLALFLADVKAAALVSMPGSKAAEQVAAISAEAARLAPDLVGAGAAVAVELPLWRRIVDKNAPRVAKAAAGVLAASMSMIGLAYAGVDLPGQAAARALEAVSGLELPNQDDGEPLTGDRSVADDVKAVVESDAEKGCSFGQAVAGAARANAKGGGGSDTDPCAASDSEGAQGSRATGEEKSAEGRATAAEKSEGASEAGADNAGDAGAQGQEASDAGADNSTKGRTSADEHAGGAGDDTPGSVQTGSDASAEGRAHAPFEVPGH